jgi:hypothetical protein
VSRRRFSKQGSTESWTCEAAKNKGAKVIILGTINNFNLAKDAPPIIWFGSYRPRSFYQVSLEVSLQLFTTNDCRLIDTFTLPGGRQHIPDRDRDAAVRQVLDEILRQLAQDIHASLTRRLLVKE